MATKKTVVKPEESKEIKETVPEKGNRSLHETYVTDFEETVPATHIEQLLNVIGNNLDPDSLPWEPSNYLEYLLLTIAYRFYSE